MELNEGTVGTSHEGRACVTTSTFMTSEVGVAVWGRLSHQPVKYGAIWVGGTEYNR